MEDIPCAGGMATGTSSMLIQAEKEVHVTMAKHKILLERYAQVAGYKQQKGKSSIECHTLQFLLKHNRQHFEQQRKRYDIQSKCSALLQSAHNATANHKTVKACIKTVNHLKVPNAKASHKMCKELNKKMGLLDRVQENTQYMSGLLGEMSLQDSEDEEEDDLALQRELNELMETNMPATPLTGPCSERDVLLPPDTLNTHMDGSGCD